MVSGHSICVCLGSHMAHSLFLIQTIRSKPRGFAILFYTYLWFACGRSTHTHTWFRIPINNRLLIEIYLELILIGFLANRNERMNKSFARHTEENVKRRKKFRKLLQVTWLCETRWIFNNRSYNKMNVFSFTYSHISKWFGRLFSISLLLSVEFELATGIFSPHCNVKNPAKVQKLKSWYAWTHRWINEKAMENTSFAPKVLRIHYTHNGAFVYLLETCS